MTIVKRRFWVTAHLSMKYSNINNSDNDDDSALNPSLAPKESTSGADPELRRKSV